MRKCVLRRMLIGMVFLSVFAIFSVKRPFFWLTEDAVAAVEWRYAYDLNSEEAYYIELEPEDQQKVIEGLRSYGVTRPMLDIEVKYASGGNNPIRVILKNGRKFFIQNCGEWTFIYLRYGEHANTGYVDAISVDVDRRYRITLKNANDKKSNDARDLFGSGMQMYSEFHIL